jgi:hypothetical protein
MMYQQNWYLSARGRDGTLETVEKLAEIVEGGNENLRKECDSLKYAYDRMNIGVGLVILFEIGLSLNSRRKPSAALKCVKDLTRKKFR